MQITKGFIQKLSDEDRNYRKDFIKRFLLENSIEYTKEKEQQLDKALDFHNILADMIGSIEGSSGLRTISRLQKKCPEIEWLELTNILYVDNMKLNENDQILIQETNLLCNIRKFFKGQETEFANHVFINVVITISGVFSEYFQIHQNPPELVPTQSALIVKTA